VSVVVVFDGGRGVVCGVAFCVSSFVLRVSCFVRDVSCFVIRDSCVVFRAVLWCVFVGEGCSYSRVCGSVWRVGVKLCVCVGVSRGA
jgi:hypothetical protein